MDEQEKERNAICGSDAMILTENLAKNEFLGKIRCLVNALFRPMCCADANTHSSVFLHCVFQQEQKILKNVTSCVAVRTILMIIQPRNITAFRVDIS